MEKIPILSDIKIPLIFGDNQISAAYALSLVDIPANELLGFYFNKETEMEEMEYTFKFEDEKQLLIVPVLVPDKLMYRRPEDINPKNKDGSFIQPLRYPKGAYVFADEPTVIKTAQRFISSLKSGNITIMHEGPFNGAKVVESWLAEFPLMDKACNWFKNITKNTWYSILHFENKEQYNFAKEHNLRGASIEAMFSLGEPILLTKEEMKQIQKEDDELFEMLEFLKQFEMEFPFDQEYEVGKPIPDGEHHIVNPKHPKLLFAKIIVDKGIIANVGEAKSILDLEKGGPEQVNEPMHKDTTEGEQQGANPMLKCK
jgi:hypothetical protein